MPRSDFVRLSPWLPPPAPAACGRVLQQPPSSGRLQAEQQESARHLERLSAIHTNLEPLLSRLSALLNARESGCRNGSENSNASATRGRGWAGKPQNGTSSSPPPVVFDCWRCDEGMSHGISSIALASEGKMSFLRTRLSYSGSGVTGRLY